MFIPKWSETVCKQITPRSGTITFIPFFLWTGSAFAEPCFDHSVLRSIGLVFSWNNLIFPPVLASLLVAVLVWFFLRMRYRSRQQQHLRLDHETQDRILQQQKLISELQLPVKNFQREPAPVYLRKRPLYCDFDPRSAVAIAVFIQKYGLLISKLEAGFPR